MASMDDMMNMSFDELRANVAPAAHSVVPPSMLTHGGSRGGPSLMSRSAALPFLPPQIVEVPDHPQELQVFLHGPGADRIKRAGISVLDAQQVCTQ